MKNLLHCNCAGKWGSFAPLVLRLVVGTIFIVHGYQKLTGLEGYTGYLTSLGVPLAGLFAVIVMIVEFFGGILLVLGFFTHWVAKLQAIEMIVVIPLVHLGNGFLNSNMGYEFPLLILAASISLMITGAGEWSLDHKMHSKREESTGEQS